MSPLAACSLFVLAVMVLMASRRLALLGMLAGVLYFSETQSLQLAGLNMYALRFLEVAGFVRVIGRREFRLGKLNRIDRVFLLLYGYTTLVFLLRSTGHYAYQIGCAVDASTLNGPEPETDARLKPLELAVPAPTFTVVVPSVTVAPGMMPLMRDEIALNMI